MKETTTDRSSKEDIDDVTKAAAEVHQIREGDRREAAETAVKTGPPRAAIPDTIRSDDRSDRRVRADRQSV